MGGGDIYQHYKQFQHLKNIARNIMCFVIKSKLLAHHIFLFFSAVVRVCSKVEI